MIQPSELTVVIPTRDRWPILGRTLEALADQSVAGFEIVVVVDGDDQVVPPDLDRPPVTVVTKPFAGSAAARNRGLHLVTTRLTMLLDDDMVPDPGVVERHLQAHERHADEHAAVLGKVVWHPDLPENRISRWLDWSNLMFDYAKLEGLDGHEVGWGRFFSCHVSFKTDFVRGVGGFDETFLHYYEDTELAKRLGEAGLEVWFEAGAVTRHLQRFDWSSVRHRMMRVAIGERLMAHAHPDFEPWFRPQMAAAEGTVRRWVLWTRLVELVPPSWGRLRTFAEFRANRWYLSRLAPGYLRTYEAAGVLTELKDHLGDRYDPSALFHSRERVEAEAEAAVDEAEHYRTSRMYPYDLAAFEVSGTKDPYLDLLDRFLAPGSHVLDHGCGIGSDGLALGDRGHRVDFADFDNPSVAFLRERLARRGREAVIHDVDRGVPGGHDAVISFDVIEHVDDPEAHLAALERLADVVAVNFLEPDDDDTHLHRPLPIGRLLRHVTSRELLAYRRFHGRSHVVVYRPASRRPVRSLGRLALGALVSRVRSRRRGRP